MHLYPLDLILLVRTNKFFRQLFMRRSAIQVWRSAEGNVIGLPPCPKGLCEPQYAALVFTKTCSVRLNVSKLSNTTRLYSNNLELWKIRPSCNGSYAACTTVWEMS